MRFSPILKKRYYLGIFTNYFNVYRFIEPHLSYKTKDGMIPSNVGLKMRSEILDQGASISVIAYRESMMFEDPIYDLSRTGTAVWIEATIGSSIALEGGIIHQQEHSISDVTTHENSIKMNLRKYNPTGDYLYYFESAYKLAEHYHFIAQFMAFKDSNLNLSPIKSGKEPSKFHFSVTFTLAINLRNSEGGFNRLKSLRNFFKGKKIP